MSDVTIMNVPRTDLFLLVLHFIRYSLARIDSYGNIPQSILKDDGFNLIRPAGRDEWSFLAVIVNVGYKEPKATFCAGALFAPKWVLTAAYCVSFLNSSKVVYLGVSKVNEILNLYNITDYDDAYIDPEIAYCVHNVECIKREITINREEFQIISATSHIHPFYTKTQQKYKQKNNIALVKLKWPAVLKRDAVSIAKISLTPLELFKDVCTTAGWGYDSYDYEQNVSKNLLVLYEIEQIGFKYFNRTNRLQTYLNTHNNIKGFLFGGIGAPLMCNNEIHAISSYVFDRKTQNAAGRKWKVYGIWTYLDIERKNWIRNILALKEDDPFVILSLSPYRVQMHNTTKHAVSPRMVTIKQTTQTEKLPSTRFKIPSHLKFRKPERTETTLYKISLKSTTPSFYNFVRKDFLNFSFVKNDRFVRYSAVKDLRTAGNKTNRVNILNMTQMTSESSRVHYYIVLIVGCNWFLIIN